MATCISHVRETALNGPHRIDHFLGLAAFGKVTHGAGLVQARGKGVVVQHRQRNHLGIGQQAHHAPCGLDAAHPRHIDVHQDDVGSGLACNLKGRIPVGCFAHDIHITRFLQDSADAGSYQLMVVDEQNFNHGR